MVLAQEFRRHAGECREVARDAPDPENEATWNELAERWDRCAALEEARGSPSGRRQDGPAREVQSQIARVRCQKGTCYWFMILN
jgi:hypothetical protein